MIKGSIVLSEIDFNFNLSETAKKYIEIEIVNFIEGITRRLFSHCNSILDNLPLEVQKQNANKKLAAALK